MDEFDPGMDAGIYIDGTLYTVDDLSFREQRAMREMVRELAPEGDVELATTADALPAFLCVVKRRTDPEFTIDQALDAKPSDLQKPPPTKRGRKQA